MPRKAYSIIPVGEPLPPYKNPKEGRSLGEGPDADPLPGVPANYPLGADPEIERSINGMTENEKTFHQGNDYWSERGRNGPWSDEEPAPSLDEKK